MATGVGEVQGSQLDIGASGAYRYVNIYQVDFDESSGKSTVYYTYGTYVNYGDFWGSTFTSEGSCYDQYTVNGVGIYDRHWGDAACEYNGSLSFWEKCYFNSYSYGYVESVVSFKWYPTLPKYTITYHANGGSGAPSAITRTWSKTNQVLSSSAPTRTGYTFKGWATTSGGSVAYAKGGSIPWASANKTQTLYAVWQKNSWTVSYNGNGSTGGSTASQTKYYNDALTLRANGFTRTGFEFKRWNTKTDDTGTAYAASGSYTSNAALSLYAIWNRTVSYNLNGASGTAPSPQTSIATSDITLAAAPARISYEFKQWNTVADDSGTAYGAGEPYPANAATTTLYAIWNPVITYKPNGASGSDQDQVKTYGTTATLKASDTYSRTGFTFKEWNTNQSGAGTPYAAGASYTSNVATTLYAIWNATLSYDANEGTGAPGSQTAKATEEITISETVPTRPGYTFLGWGTSAGASAASYQPGDAYPASGGSIVLYAVWRCDIRLTDVMCSLVDANGNADPLGRYVKASVSYDATTSGHGLSRIAMTLNHSGVDDYLEKTSGLGVEGTETFTFGPYAYDLFDPHGGYHIGRIDAENADGTISASVDLDATSYKNPVIRSLSTFRTENVGGVYEASDDGTSLGIEVSYTVSSSRTQSAPSSIAVTVKNSSGTVVATRTFSNISGASGVARLDVYHDSSFPSDILVNGELIATEDSYGVTVVVSDAYSDVVTDAKARSTDTVTIAYFTMDFLGDAHLYNPTEDTQVELGKVYYTRSGFGTFESPYVYTAVANPVAADLAAYYEANGARPGHGVAVGKPATREGLDVGTDAFFASDVSIVGDLSAYDGTFAGGISASTGTFSDDVSSSGEVSATDQNDVVHNLTEKADAASYLPLSGGTLTGSLSSDGEVSATDANDVVHNLTEKANASSLAGYLPLTGGTLTGNLEITRTSDGSGRIYLGNHTEGQRNGIIVNGGGTREGWVLSTISSSNSDGDAVLLGDGGLVIVGAGESAANLWTDLGLTAGNEHLVLGADYDIYFCPGSQTVADRHDIRLSSGGNFQTRYRDVTIAQGTTSGKIGRAHV